MLCLSFAMLALLMYSTFYSTVLNLSPAYWHTVVSSSAPPDKFSVKTSLDLNVSCVIVTSGTVLCFCFIVYYHIIHAQYTVLTVVNYFYYLITPEILVQIMTITLTTTAGQIELLQSSFAMNSCVFDEYPSSHVPKPLGREECRGGQYPSSCTWIAIS